MADSTLFAFERSANRIYDAWATWHGTVAQQTSVNRKPRTVNEMRSLKFDAEAHARSMRQLIADPRFAEIDQRLRDEIIAAAEDCEIGAAELHDHTHHDSVWGMIDEGKRADITQQVAVSSDAVLQARSRLRGELRGQPSKAKGAPRA